MRSVLYIIIIHHGSLLHIAPKAYIYCTPQSCFNMLFIAEMCTIIMSLLLSMPYYMLVSCSGQAVHRCDGCPRSYRWVKSLIRHQRMECGKKPQFHCSFCEYQAKHKSSLVKHVALKHRVIS